ncbi:hypothetical protein ENSA5_67880 [Enhygromyxa salina]|uniref:Uncharacterized protein n=1 Tax=Enhygromyxa salina TaxID=215803 RepID=A0A2S9XB88_9BACT|nr:hypothetical protein ENSA5_67880 [Enhygromyxa salina]
MLLDPAAEHSTVVGDRLGEGRDALTDGGGLGLGVLVESEALAEGEVGLSYGDHEALAGQFDEGWSSFSRSMRSSSMRL